MRNFSGVPLGNLFVGSCFRLMSGNSAVYVVVAVEFNRVLFSKKGYNPRTVLVYERSLDFCVIPV
jgi:hypothetical protein